MAPTDQGDLPITARSPSGLLYLVPGGIGWPFGAVET